MNTQWWLIGNNQQVWCKQNGLRCVFALQVHRTNKEITAECTAADAGQTRAQQRAVSANETNTVRAEARAAARTVAHNTDPYYHKEKKLRLMVVNVALLEKQSHMISKQLAMFTKNEASFVREFNQDAYDSKITKLLLSLPDPVQKLMLEDENDSDIEV